jgi:hypothetical protein
MNPKPPSAARSPSATSVRSSRPPASLLQRLAWGRDAPAFVA